MTSETIFLTPADLLLAALLVAALALVSWRMGLGFGRADHRGRSSDHHSAVPGGTGFESGIFIGSAFVDRIHGCGDAARGRP